MKKILFLLCCFPLFLWGQYKNLPYTEGSDKGYVSESQLKIDANNIFNYSAFAQTINYWVKAGESFSLSTSGIQRVLVDDRGMSIGVTNRTSRLNVLGGINVDSLIVNSYASLGGAKLQNVGNGVLSSDAVNLGQADGRYGQLATTNTWTAINNFTNPIWVKGTTAAQTAIGFQNISTSIGMIGSVFNYTGNTADNSDFGDYVYGSNNYRLFTNGSERLRVTGSGNVGIGNTNPLTRLSVIDNNNTYSAYFQANSASSLLAIGNTNSTPTIQSFASNGFSTTSNMLLNPNGGNVAIGLTTTNDRLDVNGSITSRGGFKTTHTNSVKRNISAYTIQQQVGSVTGTLVIELPIGFDMSRFMNVKISGFSYIPTTGSWEANLNLYNYGGATPPTSSYWANSIGVVVGNPVFTSIRVGYNTTTNKCCIMLGTTTTVWSYPMITVDITHNGSDVMDTGWSHSFVNTEGANYTNILSLPLNQNVLGRVAGSNAINSNEFVTLSQLQNSVSGTINYIPKFTGTNTIGNSQIFDNGSNIGIGTTIPSFKLDIVGSTRISSTDFGQLLLNKSNTVNDNYVYYLTNGKRTGYSGINAGGNFFISTDIANASIILSPNGTGLVDVSSKRISNVANATNANDAVNLSQAQNASNLTTGTIPDARISTNIARTANIKTSNHIDFTIPTQSSDYNLTFNWGGYNVHSYRVDGAGFTGSNILISHSSPVIGGLYTIIFRNVSGRNLVFSSKFLNYDDTALSTITGTVAMRFRFLYDGVNYIRID